jgi:hypothetical protein
LRAVTAGSANGLGATYFMRQPCLPAAPRATIFNASRATAMNALIAI